VLHSLYSLIKVLESSKIITVCVITYNHNEFISHALNSIAAQKTNFNYDILIADDCSTDGTKEKVLAFSKSMSNVSLILQESNVGPAKNFIELISTPKTKYISYLEGDDYWSDPYKVQKQVDYLEANPECSITSHQVLDINEKGNLLSKSKKKEKSIIIKKYKYFDENFNETASQPGSWVFRSCLINSLPTIITKVIYGDDLMWIHFLNHGYAYIFNYEMSCYRHHSNGIWSRKTSIHKCINQIINFKIISSYYKYDVFSLKIKTLIQNLDDWLFSSNDFLCSLNVSLKIFKDNPKHIIYLLPFLNLLCKKFIFQYCIPRVRIYIGKMKAFLW